MSKIDTGIKAGLRSPKTTIAGVIAALAGIFGEVQSALEGSGAWYVELDWNAVVAFLMTGAALIVARDANKSSEESNA